MTKTTIAIRNSVVMLFSFALIATLLTIVNVGVNESGNSGLSTVSAAKAADFYIGYDAGGISPPAMKPSQACTSGCSLPQKAGDPGKGTYGSGSLYQDPNVKSIYYGCSTVAGGVCAVGGVIANDTKLYNQSCTWRLENGGAVVAYSGASAVQYLKARLIGGWFNPYNSPERMYNHLTGAGLGPLPWPTSWSDLNAYYNGTVIDRWEGSLHWFCKNQITESGSKKLTTVACYPKNDGRPFPYAVGYVRSYRNNNPNTTNAVDAIYNGNQHFYGPLLNRDWQTTAGSCVYVSAATPPPKYLGRTDTCYWSLNHNGYYSQNKAAILAGGTPTSKPPIYKGAPTYQPYITGANSTAVLRNCTPQLSMNVSLSLSDGYAYYRLQGTANAQQFQTYYWDMEYTKGQQMVADIVAGPIGTKVLQAYGTHACTNPAYKSYPSWGSLPVMDFSYANCGRTTKWQCSIPNAPRINGVDNAVEVMRDGSYIPTQLGGVNISGNGVRDSNSKQVGTISDNNLSYMVQVVNGSSPFNGTNPNASKQYFQLWKADKGTTTTWNTWLSQPNANKTSYLTFYWSSDNGAVWRMNYQAKINTGEFAVPWQDTSDGPSGTAWKTETNVDCNGIKTSNAATVLRSVNSQG